MSARNNLNRLIASSALSNLADGMLQITPRLAYLDLLPNRLLNWPGADKVLHCHAASLEPRPQQAHE